MKSDVVTDAANEFSRLFNYSEKRPPHGESLTDLFHSPIYLESFPSSFSIFYTPRKDSTISEIYSSYLSFVRENSSRPSLNQCLFPLFCSSVITLREGENPSEASKFIDSFLQTIPAEYSSDASNFTKNPDEYERLARLFSSQRFIVHLTSADSQFLSTFLNQIQNSQLRSAIADLVIIQLITGNEPDRKPVPCIRFAAPISNLSILSAKIPTAIAAKISSTTPDVFSATSSNTIMKISMSEKSSELLHCHEAPVTSLSLSSESAVVLSTDISGCLNLWSRNASVSFTPSIVPPWCSSFSRKGGCFAVGYDDSLSIIYDSAQRKILRALVGHYGPVTDVSFHPNCAYLGSLSRDSSIRLWDIREAASVRLFTSKSRKGQSLCFSPDGKYLAFFDEEIVICDIGGGTVFARKAVDSDVNSLSFSTDGQYIYSVVKNGDVLSLDWKDDGLPITKVISVGGKVISAEMSEMNELKIVTT